MGGLSVINIIGPSLYGSDFTFENRAIPPFSLEIPLGTALTMPAKPSQLASTGAGVGTASWASTASWSAVAVAQPEEEESVRTCWHFTGSVFAEAVSAPFSETLKETTSVVDGDGLGSPLAVLGFYTWSVPAGSQITKKAEVALPMEPRGLLGPGQDPPDPSGSFVSSLGQTSNSLPVRALRGDVWPIEPFTGLSEFQDPASASPTC